MVDSDCFQIRSKVLMIYLEYTRIREQFGLRAALSQVSGVLREYQISIRAAQRLYTKPISNCCGMPMGALS